MYHCICCGADFTPYFESIYSSHLSDTEPAISDHPDPSAYRDLRAASRIKNRQRKHLKKYNHFRSISPRDCPSHPEQRSHYLPTLLNPRWPNLCPFDSTPYKLFVADVSTTPIAKFTKREAYKEAQWSRNHIGYRRRSGKNPSNVKVVEAEPPRPRVTNGFFFWCPRRNPWKSEHAAPTWKWTRRRWEHREMEEEASRGWEDDVDLSWYKSYQDYCIREASWEEYIWGGQDWIYGEDVDTRAILSYDEYTVSGETFAVWCQRRINEMRAVKEARLRALLTSQDTDPDEDKGCHSSTSTSSILAISLTTFPTSPLDVYGHKLLKNILKPPAWLIHHPRWNKHRPLPDDYFWFGEYTWHWHRNATGCWYVSVSSCGIIYPECSCKKWRADEWLGWDPEGGTKCWLAELTKGEGWEALWHEAIKEAGCDVVGKVELEGEEEEDWDLISNASVASSWMDINTNLQD
jgi:hypothetical protein